MSTYKSKHTGERVDNAVTKIPESLPTEDSFIVVKADGSASEYIPQSQVSSDKLDKQTAQTASDQIYGKLADGSQTMFDVTTGSEPTTIPLRDTAGRIQVADGVSGNDAVNFKQLSAVESSVSGFNIQNGIGNKAIQQVIDSDFTLVNINSDRTGQTIQSGAVGVFAAAFGGKSRSEGKRAFSTGTQTIATGNYSAAFGNNSISEGVNSFVEGSQNISRGNSSHAENANNLAAADNTHVEGVENTATHMGAHVQGYKNGSFGNYTHTEGGENVSSTFSNITYSHIGGYKNTMVITGTANPDASEGGSTPGGGESTSKPTEFWATFIDGAWNKASGTNSFTIGYWNQNYGNGTFIAGHHNIIYNNVETAMLFGRQLQGGRNCQVVFGENNLLNKNALLIVGNGTGVTGPNRFSNAFEVLKDGRAKVQTAPVDTDDVVRKLELDTKYDKTGGTIGGNVVITGDLTVNGTQHINNTENLNVENAMIYSNANGATLATNGGIGIKKNATDVYGIVYDPTSDSVKLGIGKSDANGRFTFNANEGQPVAIRDDSAQLTNNHIIKWDSTNHKLVDSGKSVDDFVNLTDNQTISGIKTFSDAANFKGATSIDGLVTAKAGITTTKIESTTGAGSYDVRSGQFTNGSAENVIKLPQKAGTIALDGDLVTTPITETETVVVDTTTVNFALDTEHDTGMYVSAENAISLGSTQLVWTSGRDKYKVIWDDVEYIVYGQDSIIARLNNKLDDVDMPSGWYSWQLLGNGSNSKLMMYNKDTVDIPFAITQDRWKNNAEWLVYATTSTAATHTIKVIKIEGTYKKVTPEYQYGYVSLFNQNKNQMIICGDHAISGNAGDGIVAGTGNTIIVDADSKGFIGNIIARGDYVNVSSATGKVEGANIEGSFNALYTSGTIYSPFLAGYMNLLKNNGVDWLSPFVAGYTNSITANKGTIHPDAVFGSNNKLTYDGNATYGLNLVAGNSHTIKNAALSLITGLRNTVECLTADTYIGSNIVGGQLNTVNHSRVIVGGGGNTSDRNSQFIAGNYSAANEKAIVKIGNGTKDAHANAFEVLDDNRAKVFGTPTENNDVLRYQDTAVEVETSLMGA